jgi:acetyltransferase
MMFGLGGTLVEQLGEVAFRPLPVGRDDALDLIGELRTQSVLDGARGAPPVNRESSANADGEISELFLAHPEIVELDLNPVIAAASAARYSTRA